MPWNIVKGDDRCPAGKPFAVVGGRSGNGLAGCHDTKESARQQQKALYASEAKSAPVEPVCYTTPTTVCW
jgi:hypothetical protein